MGRSCRVFLGACLLCASCTSQDSLPDIPRPLPPVIVEGEAVGCYEHIPGDRPLRHIPPWETPRTFYLTNHIQGYLTDDRLGAVATYGRTLPLRWVRQTEAYRAKGSWLLERPNTTHIRWTPTGEQGVWVTLRRDLTEEVWRGRPTTWHYDGTTRDGVDVAVRRLSDQSCDFLR
jgi:hypothetical protein